MPPMLTQLTEMMSPGWYRAVMLVSELGAVTGWPSTDVITSPGTRPCELAAVLHKMPRMSAPELTGAMWAGMPDCWLVAWQDELLPGAARPLPVCGSSAACCCGFGLLLCATSTPRKPGRPMYTVELGRPDAICLAIVRAVLMGMAKPSVPPACPNWLEVEVFAAVIMPMTWPALFASAPPESPCWIGALVCSMWLRFSVLFEPWSLAWIERLSALM